MRRLGARCWTDSEEDCVRRSQCITASCTFRRSAWRPSCSAPTPATKIGAWHAARWRAHRAAEAAAAAEAAEAEAEVAVAAEAEAEAEAAAISAKLLVSASSRVAPRRCRPTGRWSRFSCPSCCSAARPARCLEGRHLPPPRPPTAVSQQCATSRELLLSRLSS